MHDRQECPQADHAAGRTTRAATGIASRRLSIKSVHNRDNLLDINNNVFNNHAHS